MLRFLVAPLLLFGLAPGLAHAEAAVDPPADSGGGTVIFRCQHADGVLLFTDRPCARFGARDRLPPVEIAGTGVERRRPGVARMPTPVGAVCARDPDTLRTWLRTAIDGGDVNALAGLVDWRGMSRGPALRHLTALRRLVRRPALEVVVGGGGLDSGSLQPVAWSNDLASVGDFMTVAHRSAGGGLDVATFGLRESLGCWWLALDESAPPVQLATR